MIRDWYVGQALQSVARLNKVLPELTTEEVDACLQLESASLRRRSIVLRLIGRRVRLNELAYSQELKQKYL